MLQSAVCCTRRDAKYGRHYTTVAIDASDSGLYLFDDAKTAQGRAGREQHVYMLFLRRVGHGPLPYALFRGLSVWGTDRTALMAGCHLMNGTLGKPYEAKSDTPVLQISMGGEAPDEMHILFMATNAAQGSPPCVYDNEAQQRRAIRLLRSSPVQAWSRVAMDAWKLHENTLPTEDDEMEGDDEESAPAMERAVINQFLRGMVACSPKGTPLALFKFCGSALKEVAVRRLPEMLVEEEAKYGCYSLILESTFVP